MYYYIITIMLQFPLDYINYHKEPVLSRVTITTICVNKMAR